MLPILAITDLLQGIVIETTTRKSWTGDLIYSDRRHDQDGIPTYGLNELATQPIIGRAGGILRMALSVIHSLGHLFMALVTWNKGHCVHAAKGACEFLRGLIEAIPFLGTKFAREYGAAGEWWIIKIYNPQAPDSLDHYTNFWRSLRENRPTAYIVAH